MLVGIRIHTLYSKKKSPLHWLNRDKVKKIKEDSLLLIPSPSPSVKVCLNIAGHLKVKCFLTTPSNLLPLNLNPNQHEGGHFYLLYNYTRSMDIGSVGPWFDPCLRHIFFHFFIFLFSFFYLLT